MGASELELAQLLRWETTDQQEALDPIAWQMLQGAQNLRRWIWTVVLVALALFVIGSLRRRPSEGRRQDRVERKAARVSCPICQLDP